ncbi:MFS transporter [Leptospira langatensis]|uniref:MFS transporter n=1 Tax=Leptospira langatensis TaxID=2484983 RepID=A0A5F1ZZ14_9LEPT|nr:MFS transporter [Leptospira langatensis]TGJ98323.1 MFS transporter [Leptospira langatensis]TGL43237.1 MFS transporter [Leptospira langatensis]
MKPVFTKYQIFLIVLLAFLQFTIVLDFMILSPMGVFVMKELKIATNQFGLVVSAYAFSAGISGILAAGFADKFDRKKFLLFFYAGFVIGTVLCGIAPNYDFLLMARIITGFFAGVISSISFAIIADLFTMEVRGRVMGLVMTAFAASQVAGLPIGMYFSTIWGWRAPFLMIAAIAGLSGVIALVYMEPIVGHLNQRTEKHPFTHLISTLGKGKYLPGFAATMLLPTGGYMLMPFGSAFTVHNMGIAPESLALIYMITGISSIVVGPIMGRISDAVGKYPVFAAGSIAAIPIVIYYTSLGATPLWFVITVNCVLFAAITSRIVSASALNSAVPEVQDRGAYMAISSSMQQVSGGVAAGVAGMIVVQAPSGYLIGYANLGYVVACTTFITVLMMYKVDRLVKGKAQALQGQSTPTPQFSEN